MTKDKQTFSDLNPDANRRLVGVLQSAMSSTTWINLLSRCLDGADPETAYKASLDEVPTLFFDHPNFGGQTHPEDRAEVLVGYWTVDDIDWVMKEIDIDEDTLASYKAAFTDAFTADPEGFIRQVAAVAFPPVDDDYVREAVANFRSEDPEALCYDMNTNPGLHPGLVARVSEIVQRECTG